MKLVNSLILSLLATAATAQTAYRMDEISTEALNRGVIAMRQPGDSLSVSWRLLREDPRDVTFDLYIGNRCIQSGISQTYLKLSSQGIDFDQKNQIRVVANSKEGKIIDRLKEGSYLLPDHAPIGLLDIPLDAPGEQFLDLYTSYRYFPGDCTAADVDGDGQLEIILKWDPSNQHDNSHNGYTGNVLIDCYTLAGQKLWRIDLGPNIRAGAHYTQVIAYDLDGDGKAEVVMKTGDGTTDGKGKVIGDSSAFWPNEYGHIIEGPEYLTVFSGETGEALYTTGYVPERGSATLWGDNKGNRSERYLAGVGYLGNTTTDANTQTKKQLPSVIMCRGYYTRATLVAWDWDGKELKQRWMFDSYEGAELTDKGNKMVVKKPGPWSDYSSQGNHSIRVADVDGDGFDEIIYGSCTIDHNGKGLYSTKLGHGDAMHIGQMIPGDNRLYVWQCHEEHGKGSTLRDAKTGKILFQLPFSEDCGRCMAADIDPTNPGWEMWSICTGGLRNYKGEKIANPKGLSMNMACYWDGDTLRELLDRNRITKYNWKTRSIDPVITFEGATSINGTKAVPCLQGDLVGDWREEVLLPSIDGQHLYLYLTPYSTDYRFTCLLQDIPYRHSLAIENVAYNQPTQLSTPLK